MIASGPTVPDTTTFKDALEIMGKYHLDNSQNKKIIFHFKSGSKGVIPETLKENDPRFQKVQNVIVGNNYLAALAGKKKAEQLGFYCQLIPEQFIGDSVEVAEKIVRIIHDFNSNPYAKKPCCLIAGGEATVKVKGSGKGGRNQEVALRCAMEIEGLDNVCIATLATDGEDGPTDAAGAIVTGKSIAEARNKGIDPKLYLENNDSYNYFKKIGGLIHTGATGTNVNDLNFIFIL